MPVNRIGNIDRTGRDRWEDVERDHFFCRILVSPFNRRITVYEFNLAGAEYAEEMLRVLEDKAASNGLDKIWLKSGEQWARAFLKAGMKPEALVPCYYRGRGTALFAARFLSPPRETPSNARGGAPEFASGLQRRPDRRPLPAGIRLEWGQPEQCPALAGLYRSVYETYPFPVFDPGYLDFTMRHDVCYLSAWHNGDPVAAASAEINRKEKNAEVTDFATLPQWRGRGLANRLLGMIETRLESEGIRCLYTIARSSSSAMNKVFANAGFVYRGVLLNNCNIAGGFEDMNVWSKIAARAGNDDSPVG